MRHSAKIIVAVAGDPVDDVRQRRGDYGKLIADAIGPTWEGSYESVDIRTDDLPLEAAAVVISGSSANVHSREPWMLRAEARLRGLVAQGMPVFGICFGHQLLAQALGGEVLAHPQGREISTVLVSRMAQQRMLGEAAPLTFSANACHSDTVVRLPPGAQVLASNAHDDHQILQFGSRCYGVQFHPEFDADVMRSFVTARAEAMRGEGLDPDEALARASDTPAARDILRRFVRLMTAPD